MANYKIDRDRERNLAELQAEAERLAKSPQRIQTEEGRTLINLVTRLIETLLDGNPRTPSAEDGRHHG